MSHLHPEPEDAAPACPHDDLEAYWSGSPLEDTFAPGVLHAGDLASPSLADETPWRGRPWPAPDPAKQVRPSRTPESGSPAARAAAQAAHLEAARAASPGNSLPLAAVLRQSGGGPAAAAPATTALRVLFVHTNPTTRRQVAAGLSSHGIEVATSNDAERAVLQALHERPDAVVTEIDVSGLDALSLCRRLAEQAPGMPVLMVASGDDEGNYSLAMEAGVAEYLRRPVTPELLAGRLQAAVQRARTARPDLAPPEHLLRLAGQQVRRQELRIQSLFELSRNVVGCLELEELYHGFLLTAMGQLGLGAGVLFHLDGNARLIEVACRGIPPAEARRLLEFRSGLGAWLLRTPHPVLLEPDCCPPETRVEVERLRGAGLALACPMASKGAPVGVACFGPRISGEGFTAEDLLLLSAVCNFAGPALDSARLYTDLHLTYLSTVRAFVSSLEAKDAYTRGHSERVADYSRLLAQSCGLERHDLDMVMFGAMLHDIGKIGVAEGILNKSGPLTPEEWRVVRSHPEMGARIVHHIDYLGPAVAHILHHHERIDGRGYPYGLSGDDIELGTRVVTVCDSFDAMTTHRPYRRAMDIRQAVKLLQQHAGRQFDAQVVETFLGLLESRTIQLKS